MLTPADIDGKQFSTTRIKEGYVQDEVDDFLDRVSEDYKFLEAQIKRLESENVTLRRVSESRADAATTVIPAVAQTPSAVAERMLAAAEQAAQEHEAEAKAKADDIVREAGAQGAKVIEDAHAAAERIKADGLAEKYRRNDELEKKISAAELSLAALKATGGNVRRALGDMINSYDTEFPHA